MQVTSLKEQPSIQGDQLEDVMDIPLQKDKNEITSFDNPLQSNEKSTNNLRRQASNNNDGKDKTLSKQSRQDQNTNSNNNNNNNNNNMQEVGEFENKLAMSQAPDIVSQAGSDTRQILKKDITVESGLNKKTSVIKETSSLNNEKKVILNIQEDSPQIGSQKNQPADKNDEIKENPVSEQNRGVVSWIAAVIVFMLTLSIAVFCTVTYFIRKDLPQEYDYVIENWKNSPVINIRPSNVGCSEYLTEFDFPGTIDGCDCRASLSVTYQNKIFPGLCSKEQLQNSCTSVNSTPTKTFTSWMINSQIFRLCVDRLKGFSYTDSDCQQPGYRVCGVTSNLPGASKTNMFCLPTTSSCPINSITFGTTAPDYTYTSIFNTGIGNIFVSRQQVNSQPLSFSRISTGSGVCNDFKNDQFFDSSVTPYVLLRSKNSTCESTDTDPRFSNLFSLTETDLFTANNYLSTMSALPAYPLAQNQKYYLVTRSYIPWMQEGDCRYTHMQRFKDLESSVNMINYIWIATIGVSWIVFIALGVVVNFLRLKYNYYMKTWQVILMWLMIILLLGLIAAGFALSLILNNNISDMNDRQCSDLQTNRMISTYRDDFFMKVFLSWIIMAAAVLLLLIFCFILLNIIFFKPKEKVINDEEDNKKDHLGDDDALLLDEEDQNNDRNTRDGVSSSNKQKNTIGNDRSNGKGGYSNTYQIDGIKNNNNDTTKGMTSNTLKKNNSKSNNIDNDNTTNKNNNTRKSNEADKNGLQNNTNTKINTSSIQLKNAESTSQPKLKNISYNKTKTTHTEMEVVQEAGGIVPRSRKSIDAARDQFLLNRYGGGTKQGDDNINSNKIQSLVQMEEIEDLQDHNDWEFNIDGYVKEHREARLASKSRIGGGYDIPKNKEKQPSYKFYPRNHRSQLLNSSTNNNNNELDIFSENESANNADNTVTLKQPGDSTKKVESG